jgi:hypothetical protein
MGKGLKPGKITRRQPYVSQRRAGTRNIDLSRFSKIFPVWAFGDGGYNPLMFGPQYLHEMFHLKYY